LLYPSTGLADGVRGDALLLGPPLIISEDEVETAAVRTALAIEQIADELIGV
jgi:hypothetical protein